jgi:hypothetical protein
MSAGPDPIPCLTTSEGELVSVQLTIEPKLLESLLEALAEVPFPINPEIHHPIPGISRHTIVEFPAYSDRLREVYRALTANGLSTLAVRVENMLAHIQTN